jgi:ABC-type nitrate/sulfonate/bicarbonate transport system substrate-binding protein
MSIRTARARALPLLLCAVLALAGSTAAPGWAQTAVTTVKVGVLPNDDMIALLYGVRTGMFQKAGLDVQIDRSASNGAAIAAAVTGGSLDIGKSSLQTLIEAHLHNVPFWLIGTAAVYDSRAPYVGLLVLKDSPYTNATQIQSGVVGLSSAKDVAQIALLKSLDDAGVKANALQFTEIPMSAGAAALEQGRTVAQEISYPLAQAAIDSGKFRFIPALDTFGKTYAFSVYFTTIDYATKNTTLVKTFTRVLAAAARYTNGHHDVTAPLLADFSGIALPTIQRMPRVNNGTGIAPSTVQPMIDAEAKYGFIDHAFPAAEMIDPDVATK